MTTEGDRLLRRVVKLWDDVSTSADPDAAAFQRALDATDGQLIEDVRRHLAKPKAEPCVICDPVRMCVCGHVKSMHERRGGVLACIASGCACGPGCIHEGFVCDDGTVQDDEKLV